MYNALPNAYSGQETNCMMLAYFVVGSLDIIGELPRQKTKQIVDWVYGMQVLPDKDNPEKKYYELWLSRRKLLWNSI